MNVNILLATAKGFETNTHSGYILGAVIALLILGYLLYTLIKPEKF